MKKIGNGEDFGGTYNSKWYKEHGNLYSSEGAITQAEVYTVKNNPNLLVVKSDNGSCVVLKRTEG